MRRRVLVVVGVALGVALRVWILRSALLGGYLDSDEAVAGLMARHFLHGELSTFYWGQSYGGTAEVGLVAGVFGVAGSGSLTLRVVPMLLYALAALVVWRIGRRTIGEPAASVAGLLFWIWSAYFVFRSTREYGYQGVLLLSGLVILLLALRLREQPTRRDAAGFGFALGLGWWTSSQIALVGLPALAWLIGRRPRIWRLGWLGAIAACVGALPWIVWALHHRSQALEVERATTSSYGSRLAGFFVDGLPTALGVRVPFLLSWLPNRPVGIGLFVLLAIALLAAVARRRRPLELLIVVAVSYPFLYAASSFTANRLEPRYLQLLAPVLALLLATVLTRPRVAAAGLTAAAVFTVIALVRISDAGGIAPGAPDVRAPAQLGPLLDLLKRERVSRASADYWVAFRITFLTRERIIVAPTYNPRYPQFNLLVAASRRSAQIFVAGTKTEPRAKLLKADLRPISTKDFVVYLPRQAIRTPAQHPASG